MKINYLDKIANYLVIGVVTILIIMVIIYITPRIALNIFLIMLGILFVGFIVYEGISFINKKIKKL